MKVSLDSLDEEIKKALEDYNVEVVRATNESIKETAKEAVKTLKKGGPYKNRTGKYAKDWSAGQREKTKSVIEVQGYTVYNKENYQLTHLLEYGHQKHHHENSPWQKEYEQGFAAHHKQIPPKSAAAGIGEPSVPAAAVICNLF